MVIDGTIQQVNKNSLLIREFISNNEILVKTPNAQNFKHGDCARVIHTDEMILSKPPQVTALSVQQMRCDPPVSPHHSEPSEMSALILQRRKNELLVRDTNNNRQLLVCTPYAHHFCERQRIIITHNTIRMGNPPEVDAIDIRSIC